MKLTVKISLLLLLIIFSYGVKSNGEENQITPESLGLKISRGNIDTKKMTSLQKDTIAIQLFDYTDKYYDIAVAYRSKKKIVIYRNLGNGYLNEFKVFKQESDIKSISAIYEYDIRLPNKMAELKINFKDGTEKTITSKEINEKQTDQKEVMVPLRNILDDPHVFLYTLDFIQVWESESNGGATRWISYGDFDKDGKQEMVWTIYPVGGTGPASRMVVFECYGNDLIRIDWDTIFTAGGYNLLSYMTDFDRDGNNEFFGAGWNNQNGQFDGGIFECYGPGRYKFRGTEGCLCGLLEDVVVLDTTTYGIHTGNSGMWSLNSYSGGNTTIMLKVFNQKNNYFYSFDPVFNANDIRFSGYTYDFEAGDIDGDGRTELILGNTQFGTNYVEYLDSTGLGLPILQGYEFKEIIPNAPVSAGWLYLKDYDNDGIKEVTTAGIGNGSGSIGVIKHTGSPGTNNFTTMWWDSTNILAGPNYGIDTGSIDNSFNILYTYYFSSGPHYWCYILTYNRTGEFNFQRSSYKYMDSAATLGGLLKDIDNDGKTNIITPIAYSRVNYPYVNLTAFEQTGTIGINSNSSNIPEKYLLYQNYPNPFNPETMINYELPALEGGRASKYVQIRIYDITGKLVTTLVDKKQNAGKYSVTFNGSSLNSGVYFYSLLIDNNFISAKKMVLLK